MLLIVSQVSQPASLACNWLHGLMEVQLHFSLMRLHCTAGPWCTRSLFGLLLILCISNDTCLIQSTFPYLHTAKRNPARGLHHSHGSQWHGQLWLLRPDKWGGYATLLARSALQQHQGVRRIPVSATRRHRTGYGVCLRQGCLPDAAVHLQATGYSEWYVGSF